MQTTKLRKKLSLIVSLVLITAIALTASGCGNNTNTGVDDPSKQAESPVNTEKTVLGEGEKVFSFTVVDGDKRETAFEIHTDEKTVGAALISLGLIEGDEGQYGLYVKKVNGIVADADIDGTYWAFYQDGAYATTGVDMTEIQEGAEYAFKVEKG